MSMRRCCVVLVIGMTLMLVLGIQSAVKLDDLRTERDYLHQRLLYEMELADAPKDAAYADIDRRTEVEIQQLRDAREHSKLKHHVMRINPKLSDSDAEKIIRAAYQCGYQYGIDHRLLLAVAQTESHFNAGAIGQAGERGLMQLQKRTAESVGMSWSRAFNPNDNLCAGAAYLWEMNQRHRTQWAALRHYNGGAVYPVRVMANYRAITGEQ